MVTQPPLPVLLTRPRAQSEQFAATLPPVLRPVISPLLRILHLDDLPPAPETATLIFTSGNGVTAYATQHPGIGQPALCVGTKTTAIARDLGFDAISAEGNARAILDLAAAYPGPFVHVRGRHTTGDIAGALRDLGKEVAEIIAYDQTPVELSETARAILEGPCAVPLFSPRTACLFTNACPTARTAQIIAMSPAVAEQLPEHAYSGISILEKPNAAAMRDALLAYAGGNHLEAGRTSG